MLPMITFMFKSNFCGFEWIKHLPQQKTIPHQHLLLEHKQAVLKVRSSANCAMQMGSYGSEHSQGAQAVAVCSHKGSGSKKLNLLRNVGPVLNPAGNHYECDLHRSFKLCLILLRTPGAAHQEEAMDVTSAPVTSARLHT